MFHDVGIGGVLRIPHRHPFQGFAVETGELPYVLFIYAFNLLVVSLDLILYFRIYFFGSSAVVLYNMGASILQSVGDSRSPMKYLIAASLTNVVLDLFFVAVLGMGVGSAALATILSQCLSAFLAFRKLTLTRAGYRVNWRRVRFEGPTFRQIITLGIPSGVQSSVVSLANVIVQANINSFDSAAMAGCGAYSRIEGLPSCR